MTSDDLRERIVDAADSLYYAKGYAAVGRNGNVVTGEEVDVQGAAVGRHGAVVVGEEGAVGVGRYGGVVVADRYESYDAWKAVAAVGVGIAIGTMLAKPPAQAKTVRVSGGQVVTSDGSFNDAEHAVGGYLVLEADDEAAAIALAATMPAARHGGAIEVRPVAKYW